MYSMLVLTRTRMCGCDERPFLLLLLLFPGWPIPQLSFVGAIRAMEIGDGAPGLLAMARISAVLAVWPTTPAEGPARQRPEQECRGSDHCTDPPGVLHRALSWEPARTNQIIKRKAVKFGL